MVDIVARVIADGEVRTLSFKTNEVIFGGGRLTVTATEIPLEYADLIKVYEQVNSGKKEKPEPQTTTTKGSSRSRTRSRTENEHSTSTKEKEIADKDRYFYHTESDSYWMVKKGEEMPTGIDAEISVEMDKPEWEDRKRQNEAVKSVTEKAIEPEVVNGIPAETPAAAPEVPRRTRRARS
jgi:hypothetical protein